MKGYEMHAHTVYSDGSLTPTELVEAAAAAGLSGVAVTDHDTTAGFAEAKAAGARLGLDVIAGVEVSTDVEDGMCHILGYFVEPSDARLEEMLSGIRARRRARAEALAERLAEAGVRIEVPFRPDPYSVGRPHLAAALVAAGYAGTLDEAFERFLGGLDGSGRGEAGGRSLRHGGRSLRHGVPPAEAIERIRRAGGVAVLAHPHTFERPGRISAYRGLGLAALEADYPSYDDARRARFRALAKRLGLLTTAGSDFHGALRPGREIGAERMPEAAVVELRRRAVRPAAASGIG